ncbi:anhydro-N-acetylmuramic acid kinase [Nonlabens tegetincola]|uniref:anhydro-N-acetylmuramic acid kinase n=1 Tax=Nonlabens tegetincola TaxID=323273 RepID=UPI000A207751|nr:anhydro-N-acetylmuramic acid kinase [Nonlabens tegetincola]ARN70295.1 anhydro-N-acetylmuramic acid kinase [Nonlabens tegetincola]
MNHQYYNVLGVMSGTSLDGVDIAHVQLVREKQWTFTICNGVCIPYSALWKRRLSEAVHSSSLEIENLNKEYTLYLGQLVKKYLDQNPIEDLIAVCSHGHTIFHKPEQGYTLQIGNLPEIASIIGHRVVCDFRVQDILLGGQGAPLVPIGDQILFNDYDYCLNLGGFANISHDSRDGRIAYDICPVNTVLNHFSMLLGKEYDEDGAFAKAGKVQTPLLDKLNDIPYYGMNPPKSLGIEWVNQYVFSLLQNYDIKDVLATFVEHVAIQITKVITSKKRIICTGGGAFNTYLMDRIRYHYDGDLVIPESKIVEYKEALIFGLLGVLRLRNQVNCLSSVTGSRHDHSSGQIYLP